MCPKYHEKSNSSSPQRICQIMNSHNEWINDEILSQNLALLDTLVFRRLSSLSEVVESLCEVWSVCSTSGIRVDIVENPFVAPTMRVTKFDFLDAFRAPEVVSLVH